VQAEAYPTIVKSPRCMPCTMLLYFAKYWWLVCS